MADGGPSSQSRQYRRSSVPNRRRDRETVDDDCAMRPVPVLLLSSVVFWTGGSRAAWISDGGAGDGINDINNNNNNNNMSSGNNITAGGWIGDVSERFYSDGKAFRSLRDTANGDGGNDGTGERKISKKKPWNVYTLILGVGAKLILFLPILAMLTGKAISLSLTSLLITSLAFLYRAQSDSIFKRIDSKESLLSDSQFVR